MKVDIDDTALDALFDTIEVAAQSVETVAATTQLSSMMKRIKHGVGSNDRPMRKYSKSTRQRKAKEGKRYNVRTLQETGRMLKSFVVDSGNHSILLSNSREAKKAYYNEKRSPFLGLSPQDMKQLQSVIESFIQNTVTNGGHNGYRR